MFHLLALVFAQNVPIPSRPIGLSWGSPNGQIVLEMYADLLCPNCAESWKTMMKLIDTYPTQLTFKVIQIPLPYHTWSYLVTRSVEVAKNISEEIAKQVVDKLFRGDQDKFSNQAMSMNSENTVVTYMMNYMKQFGIETTVFEKLYKTTDIQMAARGEFKYSASHGVSGTPTFFINGVMVDLESGTFEEFKKIIDGLLAN